MTDPEPVPTIDAARQANVSVRQLRHWAQCGYLHPTKTARPRQGAHTLTWSAGDIDRAELLGVLSRAVLRADVLTALANAAEHGTALVINDDPYRVVVSWEALT